MPAVYPTGMDATSGQQTDAFIELLRSISSASVGPNGAEVTLAQITMRCRYPSFLRKQESRPPAPRLWMPAHGRHDESVVARRQLIVNRARPQRQEAFGKENKCR